MNCLKPGVKSCFIENSRFKTRLFTARFLIPLKKETVTAAALAANLVSDCTPKYPSPELIRRRLRQLCGADIGVSCEKSGNNFLITFFAKSIDDSFGLGGEKCFSETVDLLYNMLFMQPEGEFFEKDVKRTKRIWHDKLLAEQNDKRSYALRRMTNIMFGDEGAGIPNLGYREDMEKADGVSLRLMWEKILTSAQVRLCYVGPDGDFSERLFLKFAEALPDTDRVEYSRPETLPAPTELKKVTERMKITQGKLVLGFSTDERGADADTAHMAVFADIFGGGPYSKLFSVVREKMSLCYYCTARISRVAGFMTVESGIEEKNAEPAFRAISAQLQDIADGNFSDEVLAAAKKSICESLRSAADRLTREDDWYGARMGEENPLSPAEYAEKISAVTRDEVIATARRMRLDTAYFLLGEEVRENA